MSDADSNTGRYKADDHFAEKLKELGIASPEFGSTFLSADDPKFQPFRDAYAEYGVELDAERPTGRDIEASIFNSLLPDDPRYARSREAFVEQQIERANARFAERLKQIAAGEEDANKRFGIEVGDYTSLSPDDPRYLQLGKVRDEHRRECSEINNLAAFREQQSGGAKPVDEETGNIAPIPPAAPKGKATPGKPSRKRMKRSVANVKAMKLARADTSFAEAPKVRRWANEIGCSTGLITKLPFWGECQKRLPVPVRQKQRKGVALTDGVAATLGQNDPELERLIDEQTADFEPSPLDNSPHRRRSRRPSV